MGQQEGIVLQGINNIYTLRLASPAADGPETREARIKGKVLRQDEASYNPLAPGDRVILDVDTGMILDRQPRRNQLVRWNKKRQLPQIIAANVDHVYCVSSPHSPPFRPRFIDRMLIAAEKGGCSISLLMNKWDQMDGESPKTDDEREEILERLDVYGELGYQTRLLSAATGRGFEEWAREIEGKTIVLAGQSGVGKSTILNRLIPGLQQRTGEISAKHNRGRHTTCFSLMYPWKEGSAVIDTPGIREIELHGIPAAELSHWFPEMEGPLQECRFAGCLHNEEPGCAVKEALEEGRINPDRYLSYLTLLHTLVRREGEW